MTTSSGAISKQDARLVRPAVLTGEIKSAQVSSAGNTLIELGSVCQKVTVITTGSLVVSASFSIDGETFYGAAAASTTPLTYSTNLIKIVKIAWTSGSGTVTVAGV